MYYDLTKEKVDKLEKYINGAVRFSVGNIKTGKDVLTFSKCYGNELAIIPEINYNTEDGTITISEVVGSCGLYCVDCRYTCYVRKSLRYSSVQKNHVKNTLAFRYNLNKAFKDLDEQLTHKRRKAKIVRINQSGELESKQEFIKWLELASKHPETQFYIYTKAYDIVIPVLLALGKLPENFTILISIWENLGVKEYEMVKHIAGVKSFVCITKNAYVNKKLNIETFCKAYDLKGKLNHSITCDKCLKCTRLTKCKVIGCYEH